MSRVTSSSSTYVKCAARLRASLMCRAIARRTPRSGSRRQSCGSSSGEGFRAFGAAAARGRSRDAAFRADGEGDAFEGAESLSSGIGGFIRSLLAGIPWSEGATGESVVSFDTPESGVLKIKNLGGRTRVLGEERDDIEVTVDKRARAETGRAAEQLLESIDVASTRRDGALDLSVSMPKAWNRLGCANLEVRVPRGLVVEVTSSSGRLCLSGLRGPIRARSSNGSISIHDVVGDIEVQTSNAKVKCDCTFGRLIARSSNGRIELGEHSGSADVSTSNGLIKASLNSLGHDGVVLATSNGRIVLDLPEDVDGEVDIRVDNGVIRNCRSLQREQGEPNGRIRGTLGRGGAPIKLRTSNGTISVR